MKSFRLTVSSTALALVLGMGLQPAQAAGSFEFLFSMSSVQNDSQYFLNLAVADAGYSRAVVEPVLPRIGHLETDLPVILFLAKQSGRPLDFIAGLRAQGLDWSLIFSRVSVPLDVLFVGIDRDPGPPYGKAWGYWKKSPRHSRLPDSDVAGLVHVQIGSHCAGVGTAELASRGSRKRIVTIVADKKGRPYDHGQSSGAKSASQRKSKGKGKR